MTRRLAQAAVALLGLALLAFAWHCDGPWFERHVFLPQQFFIAAGPGIVIAARALAAGTAGLLLFLIPRVPGGAASLRLALAVLLALPAAEILLRWRMPRSADWDRILARDPLVTWDPRYGFTLAPDLDRVETMAGRQIRFRTDAERRRISGARIDPEAQSLVFIGESAVAGMGLQWEETFPAILGARLRLQVVNLGSQGYRADQAWMRLRDGLPKLAHPAAVVSLFMPGLLGRTSAGWSPSGPLERSALYRLWKHLYWSDARLEEAMRSVGSDLRDTAGFAKAHGAPCIFLVTGKTPPWMLHQLFEAQALDFVVVDVPEDELLSDSHPGPQGSLRFADALEARLRTTIAKR